MVVRKSSASSQLGRYISFCFEGVVNLRRRLIRVYADVENAVGMPPEKLRNHIQNNIGDASTNFAFLAKRNQDALGEQWRAAGFQICLAGNEADSADHRLIATMVRDIQQDSERGNPPGTLVLIATGDGVYKDVLKLAERLGWQTIVIGWGNLSATLIAAAHESINLAKCST